MEIRSYLFLLNLLFASGWVMANCPSVLNHKMENLVGETVDMCKYSGKVVLAVNTASKCGFTPQFEALEELHQKYKERGFTVIGFPANDFGGQEPGSNKEIKDFCELNYGVKFPMMSKTSVKKSSANPIFAELINSTGVAPKWNFYKYLISRDGSQIHSFSSVTGPTSKKLLKTLEQLLDESV